MAAATVHYELCDGIAVITMDDGKANALSPAVIQALHTSLDRAEREAAAVLLTGRARRLSGGFDLSVMTSSVDAMRALVTAGADLLLRVYLFPRPVVVACNGHALAMGALLLLAALPRRRRRRLQNRPQRGLHPDAVAVVRHGAGPRPPVEATFQRRGDPGADLRPVERRRCRLPRCHCSSRGAR